MPVSQTVSEDGKQVFIAISDRFDFSMHREFRAAYEGTAGPGARYHIDLSKATYMDSSGLGMLLLLRDFAGGDKAEITIANAPPDIYRVLEIANFHQIFRMA